jgi:hypothetical protein
MPTWQYKPGAGDLKRPATRGQCLVAGPTVTKVDAAIAQLAKAKPDDERVSFEQPRQRPLSEKCGSAVGGQFLTFSSGRH